MKGFYVTVDRGEVPAHLNRIGWLLGPYASEPEARGHVARARNYAIELDGRNHFYAYGVSSIERPDGGKPLPPGVLNKHIELDGEIGL